MKYKCERCGTYSAGLYCSECGYLKQKDIHWGWIIVAILCPLLGLIGGIIYGIKGRDKSGLIILLSISLMIIYYLILIAG